MTAVVRDYAASGTGSTAPGLRAPVLYGLMAASGFAGLGYEMVWTRMLATALGHEMASVLAVLAALFLGIACGAFLLDGPIRRSTRPALWYAGLEALIGLWALALLVLVPLFGESLAVWTGERPSPAGLWGRAFLATFLLLLPATAAMGATLPAMDRLFRALRRDGWTVGGLYGANTLGAVAGTLLSTLWLLPALGYTGTLLALAGMNGLCALGMLLLASPVRAAPAASPRPAGGGVPAAAVLLVLTGLLGLGYEVLAVRVLSQVMQNTVYTFTLILAVYLLGTALGAAAYQRYGKRLEADAGTGTLTQLASVCVLLGTLAMWGARPLLEGLDTLFGPGLGPALLAEALVAASVLLPATLVMGALFSHLAQHARDTLGLGRALALNTLGAALAPPLVGLVVLPALGARPALLGLAAAYLLLRPLRLQRNPAARRPRIAFWLATAGIAVLLVLTPPLRMVTVPAGGGLEEHVEGVMASVSVLSDARGHRHLVVNDRFTMGGTSTLFSDRRQAHIPLLLHPDPQRALFLGVGTGITLAAATDYPDLQVTGVELVPEMLPLMAHFGASSAQLAEAGAEVLAADARRFVTASQGHYDVVVADLFHPSRDGAGALYTVEHFEAIRARLAPGGLFCQWLPLYQMDLGTLRTVLRSFLAVFPDAQAYLAHYSLQMPLLGLVGFDAPPAFGPGWTDSRLATPRLAEALRALRLDSDLALFGNFIAGGPSLQGWAGPGPLNTDALPRVTYEAPRFVYEPAGSATGRLLRLVDALPSRTGELLGPQADQTVFADRLDDYWSARGQFLAAGQNLMPTADPGLLLERLREPLLGAVRSSAEFEPAYRPLLAMAEALHARDPERAMGLLTELARAAPSRPEAAALRRRLGGTGEPTVGGIPASDAHAEAQAAEP